MYTRMTTVCNPTGLHARPATEFVNRAKQYKSRITICNPQEEPADTVNAQSVVLVLSLGLAKGSQVEITAQGEDEQQAVDELIGLLESGFGEL